MIPNSHGAQVASASSVPSAVASNVLPVAVTSSAVTSATRNSTGGAITTSSSDSRRA